MFSRLFDIQPGEAKLVLILGGLLAGHSFVLEINEIIATSGFLNQVSVENILLIWSIGMMLIMVSGTLQSFILDRYDRKVLLACLCIAITAIYVGLGWMFVGGAPDWLAYSCLFVVSDQQWLFFPLIFWVLANDLFSMAQAKRLFPLIIGMGFLGQIAGILVGTTAHNLLAGLHLTSPDFLGMNAAIFAFLASGVWLLLPSGRYHAATSEANSMSVRQSLTEGWDFVRNVASFRWMCVGYLGLAIAITVVRFHFLVVSGRELPSGSDFQTFYGICRLIIVLLSILMTAFVTSRLLKWLQLQEVFLVTPGGVLAVILAMLLIGGLLVGTGGIIAVWVLYNTLDQSTRKAIQSLIPEERRGRVSLFMDSYVPALGVIVAGLSVHAIVRLAPVIGLADGSPIYLSVGLIAAVLSIGAVLKLRQVYDASLLNWRMNRRKRGSSVLKQLEL